ncbi:MAG: YdcF family protein [Oscillospiraceae bacterium]|nr:YdcF family protein [Oscillospiraceae bacterium]
MALFLLLLFFAACFAFVSILAGAGAGNIGAWFPLVYFSLLFAAAYNKDALGKLLKKAYRPLTAVFYTGMFSIAAAFALFAVFILSFPADMPKNPDVVIVLGCQVYGDRPGDMLKSRLDAAAGILAGYPDLICVVSGGQGPNETVPEADTMEKYLIGQKTDPGRIYKENESSSTFLNLILSKAKMEENNLKYENIIIVTNEYHIPRAVMLAKRVYTNSNIYAVKAKSPPSLFGSGLMREFFAFVKSYIFDKPEGLST